MKKNDTLFICKFMFITVLLFSTFTHAQCVIDHTTSNPITVSDVTPTLRDYAQSFVATCSGDMEYFQLESAGEAGTISAGTLNIYSGNTVSGTPIYTQSYPDITITTVGDPIRFDITGTVPLVLDSQYTFEFTLINVGFIAEYPSTYAGGNLWANGESTPFTSVFSVSILESTLGFEDYNQPVKKLYPNPATNFIKVSNLKNVENYVIYNVLGAKISNGVISNNNSIDIQSLTNGLYFLKFENGNILKFIKE